ncbi:hypothetical protein CAOG_08405, partial [Capsaspora owczarzaki ATCC 30864]|uniref:hypothetical protein n=1 Tax=Capsaspora owczarzaki (strain ATCC 30864) TaxID=595528 RepID=UPI0003524AC7
GTCCFISGPFGHRGGEQAYILVCRLTWAVYSSKLYNVSSSVWKALQRQDLLLWQRTLAYVLQNAACYNPTSDTQTGRAIDRVVWPLLVSASFVLRPVGAGYFSSLCVPVSSGTRVATLWRCSWDKPSSIQHFALFFIPFSFFKALPLDYDMT